MSVARTVSLSFSSSSSSSLLLGSSSKRLATTPRSVCQPHSAYRRGLYVVMASPSQPLEVCVKAAATSPEKLGDCPFSQRVLLTLEEKKLPYDLKLIDLSNKPDWFVEANPEGKVPVMKLDEKWVSDSDVIAQMLEERFPERPLATPSDKAASGSKIFSAFINFLKSKDPSDATEQELINELKSFDNHIKEHGPFINGKEISSADLALGPKLYHLEVALSHYKKWSIPESLHHLKSYMNFTFSRDSFEKTKPQKEDVIAGWRPKVVG